MVAKKAFGVMKDRDLFDQFFILVFGYFWPFAAEFYVVGSFETLDFCKGLVAIASSSLLVYAPSQVF